MKKALSLLLVMTAVVSLFGFNAGAEVPKGAEAMAYPLPYYFGRLTETEAQIYLELRQGIIDCKESVTINSPMSQDQFSKFTALIGYFDSYTFNVRNVAGAPSSESVTFSFAYKYSKENYDKIIGILDKQADAIISAFPENLSVYSKITYIHDYIINNADYDLTALTSDLAYGALALKKAKCDGYAKAFAYVCEKAGIPVITVPGRSAGEGAEWHMWNKVRRGSKWYNVDLTNNDTVYKDYGWKDNAQYKYFMISDAEMSKAYLPQSEQNPFGVYAANDDSISFFSANKLKAETVSEAKTLIKNEFIKASNAGRYKITAQFGSKQLYDRIKKDLFTDNGVYEIMDAANSETSRDFSAETYMLYSDDNYHTVTVYFFYPNTKLSSYFKDVSKVDDETKSFLAGLGIT